MTQIMNLNMRNVIFVVKKGNALYNMNLVKSRLYVKIVYLWHIAINHYKQTAHTLICPLHRNSFIISTVYYKGNVIKLSS